MAVTLPLASSPGMFHGGGKASITPKVRLVHVSSGVVLEAWPVDAREHLAAGDYILEGADAPPPAAAPAVEPAPQGPSTTSTKRRVR